MLHNNADQGARQTKLMEDWSPSLVLVIAGGACHCSTDRYMYIMNVLYMYFGYKLVFHLILGWWSLIP